MSAAICGCPPEGCPGYRYAHPGYACDPIGFLMEFDLYLFLLAMGTLGVLVACRDVFLEVIGPQSFFDLHGASKLITVFTTLLTFFFLAVFAVGVFQKFV
jgi:cytochrome b